MMELSNVFCEHCNVNMEPVGLTQLGEEGGVFFKCPLCHWKVCVKFIGDAECVLAELCKRICEK